MANWTVAIEVASLSSKLANVTATRTDGEEVRQFTLPNLNVDTHDRPVAAIRAEVVAKLWADYQAALADEAKVVAMLEGWEAALVSDLNEREG